jgi:hypothetical protein
MVLTEEDATQLKHSRGSCSLSFEVRPFLSENWYLGVAGSLSGYVAVEGLRSVVGR